MNKKEALVIGAGGHSRVVLSILDELQVFKILGVIDIDYKDRKDENILNIPVLGSIEKLDAYKHNINLFLAIGENSLRKTWYKELKKTDFVLPNLFSPRANVDQHAKFGEANIVCANAFIGPEAKIGNNNIINTSAVVEHEVKISSHCHIAPSSTICGRSEISDNCFVGAGSTIIDKIKIADSSIIGAGSTVVSSIKTRKGTHVGVPARPLLKR